MTNNINIVELFKFTANNQETVYGYGGEGFMADCWCMSNGDEWSWDVVEALDTSNEAKAAFDLDEWFAKQHEDLLDCESEVRTLN